MSLCSSGLGRRRQECGEQTRGKTILNRGWNSTPRCFRVDSFSKLSPTLVECRFPRLSISLSCLGLGKTVLLLEQLESAGPSTAQMVIVMHHSCKGLVILGMTLEQVRGSCPAKVTLGRLERSPKGVQTLSAGVVAMLWTEVVLSERRT